MKVTIFLAAVFALNTISTTAFAFPSLNDQAVWSVTETSEGVTTAVTETMTITTLDAENDSAEVTHTIAKDDQVIQTEVEPMDLATLTGEYDVLDQCGDLADQGAMIVKIVVNGKKYTSCYIKTEAPIDDQGTIAKVEVWYGKVPFGILKSSITTDKLTREIALKSYIEN